MTDNTPQLQSPTTGENLSKESKFVQADYILNRNFFKLLNGSLEGAIAGLILAPFTRRAGRTITLTTGMGIGYYLRESYSEYLIFNTLNNPTQRPF